MKRKVLIVEDEALIGAELSDNINDLGYMVTGIVNTGEKALENIDRDKPDIVLMDIKLKSGMDGIETSEIIKKINGPPVIFLTAYLNDDLMERAKVTEPFGYLIKPVDLRVLNSTIEVALYKAKMESERSELLEELKATQEELEKVRNFIPICSGCKKIRSDKDFWEELEAYVTKNFSATFSHGICPDCALRLYPEMFEDDF
ncbi:MAG: response regulator [Deltaproteobacteria bacterium]|nr:response regulator [Deltaproteobacteria bacterium]